MTQPISSRRWTGVAVLSCLALCACNPFEGEIPQLQKGIAAYNASKWADAAKLFDQANQQTPSSEGHFDDGSALYHQKKLDDAEEQMRRVLSTRNDDLRERAYFNLGNIDAKSGNLDKAKEDYRRALELHPDDMDARYNLELVLLQQRAKKKQKGHPNPNDKKDGAKKEAKNDKNQQDKNGSKKNEQQGKQQQAQNGQGQKKQEQEGKQQQAQNGQKQDAQKSGAQQQQAQAAKENQGQGQKKDKQADQAVQMAQNGQGDKSKGTKESAAAVLDALQAGEKPLQMWRFETHRNAPRNSLDQNW